jgi:glycine cleavage system aminomethyltransferase T
MTGLDERALDHAAIRTRVGIDTASTARPVRVRGSDARAAVSWLLPSRLHLRDAQARQSLLLDAHGVPLADALVAADDESYLLLLDGPGDPVAHARAHLRGDAVLDDLSESHALVDVHGPWAWELVAEALGSDLLALPYLNFFRIDEGYCLRAGRTGEFGYHFLVERRHEASVRERLRAKAPDFEAREVSHDAVSIAGFENWFFDAHHAPGGATPVELGLSWRLAPDRDWLGRAAVDARRATHGPHLACLRADALVPAGERVLLEGHDVGAIVRAIASPSAGGVIASALLSPRLVAAGLTLQSASGVTLRTVAPPFVDNQSLYVDPRRHTFRALDEVRFGAPPTVAS